ncbi:MAG: hypothetical protein H6704_09885 [Myxococcales bacterium]|nr:hypothetical protein [Myxococcales bacterium]
MNKESVGAGVGGVLPLPVVLHQLEEEQRVEHLVLQAVRGAAHQEGHVLAALERREVGPAQLGDVLHVGLDEGLPVGQLAVAVVDGVARVGEGGADEGGVLHLGVGEEVGQLAGGQRLDGPAGDVDVAVDAVRRGSGGQRQEGGGDERGAHRGTVAREGRGRSTD